MNERPDESEYAWDPAGQERAQRRWEASWSIDDKLDSLDEMQSLVTEIQDSRRRRLEQEKRPGD